METYVDAQTTWEEEIRALTARGMSRQRAASLVNRRNPGLREQMLSQFNAEHGRNYEPAR